MFIDVSITGDVAVPRCESGVPGDHRVESVRPQLPGPRAARHQQTHAGTRQQQGTVSVEGFVQADLVPKLSNGKKNILF